MEEQHDTRNDNPDSVFLNPEYLESLNKVPEITDDEFREFILTHNYEMPIELQKYVEEYMSNPLNKSDSRILGWIKDWIEHPEKSKIYRDKIPVIIRRSWNRAPVFRIYRILYFIARLQTFSYTKQITINNCVIPAYIFYRIF